MGTKKRMSCALVLIAALSCAPALAQSETPTPAGGASSGAPQEGVKVHGDWTLTVRNPDGTIAGLYEFKNALAIEFGADVRLAGLLGGALVPGKWMVTLLAANLNACGESNCTIAESPAQFVVASNDLTRTVPQSGPDVGKLVLRGSVRILITTTINAVWTGLGFCGPSVSPDSCASMGTARVTTKTLNPVVPVAQDQLVEVKVVISFS